MTINIILKGFSTSLSQEESHKTEKYKRKNAVSVKNKDTKANEKYKDPDFTFSFSHHNSVLLKTDN